MQSFELNKTDILKIKQALEGEDKDLLFLLADYHASEIAIIFESLSLDSQKKIINLLPIELASEIISEMNSEAHPEDLLIDLDPEKRLEIVEELDYDDATDIISQMDKEDQHEILEDLDKEDASNIRNLLNYPEDTAGGLMNTQLIKIDLQMSKKQAIDEIILQSEEIEEFYTIYVVDKTDTLQGIVSLKDIIKSKADISIAGSSNF